MANPQRRFQSVKWLSCVPVRRMNGKFALGGITETQVTKNGKVPPRPKYKKRPLTHLPANYLLKLCVLKRSVIGARLVPAVPNSDGIMFDPDDHEEVQNHNRTVFYSKMVQNGGREKIWSGDIIIGVDHRHFSVTDQLSSDEQNGNYKSLGPIPDRFMLNRYGQLVNWKAPPLSDHRSRGRWVLNYKCFYVFAEMESDEGPVPDRIVFHRVGAFKFV